MRNYITMAAALAGCSTAFMAGAENLSWQSPPTRVALVELYTSEGCSSCPPAEAWFSKLKKDDGLWKEFVPVAFHVDYWDRLGWPDKYASPAYTERQNDYAAAWHSDSIYTPEVVENGKEHRGFSVPSGSDVQSGVLHATLSPQRDLNIFYLPDEKNKHWEAHVALLGFGFKTEVRAGENEGRTLPHDFVALSLLPVALNQGRGKTKLPTAKPGEDGIAIWVTEAGSMVPVQATGGWLKGS